MGWLDNLLGRGRDSAPEDKEPTRVDDAETRERGRGRARSRSALRAGRPGSAPGAHPSGDLNRSSQPLSQLLQVGRALPGSPLSATVSADGNAT